MFAREEPWEVLGCLPTCVFFFPVRWGSGAHGKVLCWAALQSPRMTVGASSALPWGLGLLSAFRLSKESPQLGKCLISRDTGSP